MPNVVTYIVAGPDPCNRIPPDCTPEAKPALLSPSRYCYLGPTVNGSTRLWEHRNPVGLLVQGTGSGSATVETQGPGIVEVGSIQGKQPRNCPSLTPMFKP